MSFIFFGSRDMVPCGPLLASPSLLCALLLWLGEMSWRSSPSRCSEATLPQSCWPWPARWPTSWTPSLSALALIVVSVDQPAQWCDGHWSWNLFLFFGFFIPFVTMHLAAGFGLARMWAGSTMLWRSGGFRCRSREKGVPGSPAGLSSSSKAMTKSSWALLALQLHHGSFLLCPLALSAFASSGLGFSADCSSWCFRSFSASPKFESTWSSCWAPPSPKWFSFPSQTKVGGEGGNSGKERERELEKHRTSHTLKKRKWKNTAFSITPGKGNWKNTAFSITPGKGNWKNTAVASTAGMGTGKAQHVGGPSRHGQLKWVLSSTFMAISCDDFYFLENDRRLVNAKKWKK